MRWKQCGHDIRMVVVIGEGRNCRNWKLTRKVYDGQVRVNYWLIMHDKMGKEI